DLPSLQKNATGEKKNPRGISHIVRACGKGSKKHKPNQRNCSSRTMANLDDFFAKKDKKKGKAKKFGTAEEIAKQLDDTSKKAVESKMKLKSVDPADGKSDHNQPEDEWKVFEETKKDYSGLKLAQLTIDEGGQNNDMDNGGDANDPNYDGEGRENEERDPSKPWNKLDAAAKEKAAAAAAAAAAVPEPPATTSNIYISPAMKSLMAKQKQKKGIAPDLQSEEYFPTLGQEKPAEPPKPPKPDPSFEEVKHGLRTRMVEQSTSSQISIGNRFNSLKNDAS
uniref:Uncharacterized protein n=1 Tax=Anopheles dirus TaxID=7168 RepID=A0A182NFQ5_9DIPT